MAGKKVVKRIIKPSSVKGLSPVMKKKRMIEIPDEREMKVYQEMQKGATPVDAMRSAGFTLPDKSATEMAKSIHAKFNDRMKDAYDLIGITPEYIAGTHKDILEEGKDGDRLKAIDQIMQIRAGYAPKQVEVSTKTFEQAVIEIGQIVNVHSVNSRDLKALFKDQDQEVIDVAAS